jgi:hypothetical protein
MLETSTLPNLLSSYPSFQIDGNFGAAAAVVECLVQSFELTGKGQRVLRILPSWPREWGDGEVRGVRCRGGWSVGFKWKDGAVEGAVEIKSVVGEEKESTNGHEGEKKASKHGHGQEKMGVVVFPDGQIAAFEGAGPHFCQAN